MDYDGEGSRRTEGSEKRKGSTQCRQEDAQEADEEAGREVTAYEPLGPAMMCRVCARPLEQANRVVGGVVVGVSYAHGFEIPGTPRHKPEPVIVIDEADQVGVCDFCQNPFPVWVYPCGSFTLFLGKDPIKGNQHYGSVEDWGACEACHVDIQADRWDVMEQRSATQQGLDSPAQHKVFGDLLREFWQGFREHRNGDPYREI